MFYGVSKEELQEFGAFFAKQRVSSGYKRKSDLAKASGVSIATISRIESGMQKPNPETLKILAEYLNVTYEDLASKLNYTQEKAPFDSTPPVVKKIIHSLERANDLEDEDYEIIADHVERLIQYAQKKKKKVPTEPQ